MNNFGVITVILSVTGACGLQTDMCPVMEGDSVTLPSSTEIAQNMKIKWYFNQSRIAEMTEDPSRTCTDVQCNENGERFVGRLKLDRQTGSLTITNISTSDSGLYQLLINSDSTSSDKTFSISVKGAHEVERGSVTEGEAVTLHSNEKRTSIVEMALHSKDCIIAVIPQDFTGSSADDQDGDDRFRGRLKLDNQTGSLTITDIRPEDSGEYILKITRWDSSPNCQIIVTSKKKVSVEVTALPGSGLSPGAIAAMVCVFLLSAIGAGVVYYRRCHRKQYDPTVNGIKTDPEAVAVSYQTVIQTDTQAANGNTQ